MTTRIFSKNEKSFKKDIVDDSILAGSYRVILDLSQLYAIPMDQRKIGMLTFVISNGHYYNLVSGIENINWNDLGTSLGGGGSSFAMPDNLVLVDPLETEIIGERYQNIENALLYIDTQTPTINNRWGVKLAGGVFNDNFTIRMYTSIIGERGSTELRGTITVTNAGDHYHSWHDCIYNCIINCDVDTDSDIIFDSCIIKGITGTSLIGGYYFFFNCFEVNVVNDPLSNVLLYFCDYSLDIICQSLYAYHISYGIGDVTCEYAELKYCILLDYLDISTYSEFYTCNFKYWSLNRLLTSSKMWDCTFTSTEAELDRTLANGSTIELYNCIFPLTTTVIVPATTTLNTNNCINLLVNNTGGTWSNSGVLYDNTASLLTSTNVQDAIDEIVDMMESESITVKGTTGGLIRKVYEATTGAMAGASANITLNIPATVYVIGIQFRVDTLITSGDGATSWTATFDGGLTIEICDLQIFTQNTKVSSMAGGVTEAVTNIIVTPDSNTFSGGEIRAIVYVDEFIAMDDV